MEIHQLRYFLAVVQTGSFTRGAERANVSQPSLSAQIAKLEDELGGVLFERGRQGARLTARGRLLHTRAGEIIHQLERVQLEMEELEGLRRGGIHLGCLPATGTYLLPPLLQSFTNTHPGLEVELTEASSPGLAGALRNFEVEMAITDEAGLGPGLEADTLFTEPVILALPLGHHLAGPGLAGPGVSLEELKDESFIMMKQSHGFQKIIRESLEGAGVQPRVVLESGEIETIQGLVAAGLGIGLVPRMIRRDTGLAYRSISGPNSPSRTLFLLYRALDSLSPAARALRQTALRVLRNWPSQSRG